MAVWSVQMRFAGSSDSLRISTTSSLQKNFCSGARRGHELPPRSVLLTCDDGLRNSLFDMLPILQEFGLECLFFVTGASLSHTPTMLWYEELYLMFLAAPGRFTLELLEIGLQADASQEEKRSLWWELVKKLSQYDLNRRRTLLGRIRMQLGLSERWDAEYREDPVLSRRFSVLNQVRTAVSLPGRGCASERTPSLIRCCRSHRRTRRGGKSRRASATSSGLWGRRYGRWPIRSAILLRLRRGKCRWPNESGFKSAFLNVGGGFGTETPKFALPRVHITAEMSLVEFEAHISGFHRSLRELFRPAGPSAAAGSNA